MATTTIQVLAKSNLCRKLSFDNSSFILPVASSLASRGIHNTPDSPTVSEEEKDKRLRTPTDWVSGGSTKFPSDWMSRGIVQLRSDWVSGSQQLLESGLPNSESTRLLEAPPETRNFSINSRTHSCFQSSQNTTNNSSTSSSKHERYMSKRNKYTIGPERIQRFFDPLYLGYIPGSRKYSTYSRSISSVYFNKDLQKHHTTEHIGLINNQSILQRQFSSHSTEFGGSTQPLDTTDLDPTLFEPTEDGILRIPRVSKPLEWSYLSGGGQMPLLGMTIGQALDRASELFGDREAVVSMHQGIRKTFTDLQKDSTEVAAGLLGAGLVPGDRLGIWSPNNYEWLVTLYAAAKAGIVLVNINPAYKASELEYCLNKVSVKGLVCASNFKTSNYYEILCEVAPELSLCLGGQLSSSRVPHLTTVIMMGDQQLPGTLRFKDLPLLRTPASMASLSSLSTSVQFDHPCNIQFTSGTTGIPKGAVLSHHNVVNNANLFGDRIQYQKKAHRICLSVPLYHCFGTVLGALAATLHGATCVLPSDSFSGEACVRAIQEESITSCYGTPTMFVDILAAARREGIKPPASLSTGVIAGAPCPPDLVRDLITKLNMKQFLVVYGMTETSPAAFQCFPDDPPYLRTSTIGFPSSHTEVKIIDNEGSTTPAGVEGELCVRGYCVFLGYWGEDDKTKEIIGNDRWLKTGDLAIIDRHGYGAIRGRKKDVIIRGGENIYPAELENFFMGHPMVKEAQVFGVPDSRMGEEVSVWLRLEEGQEEDLTEESFRAWCKGKIAHYKIPRYVLVKSSFPMTVTGKIQKFAMRELTMQERGIQA